MIRNYLKIAYRNLTRYRFISFINLFGLTIGLACCFLILVYILHELSYDRQSASSDRIYRVTRTFKNPESGVVTLHLGSVAPPFGPLLQNDFKEIEKMTRMVDFSPTPIRYGEKNFNEQSFWLADENVFDFFHVKLLKGNPESALREPFSVILTEESARKYFGDEDPMNKVLRSNNQFDLKVTGVYKAFPANTHLHPDMMVSFTTLNDTAVYGAESLRTNWGNNSFLTYIQLPEGYDPARLEAQFPAFLDRHMFESGKYKTSQWTSLSLQKLTDIHLRSHLDYEAEENGDIKRVYIFSAIALFILLIACINYMNLSTARSSLRAREIGIRKVVGAERREIIAQFLTESVLITLVASILAFGLTWLLLPWLNRMSGQELSMQSLLQTRVLLTLVAVPFLVGIVSGIYPALFMSSFKPIRVLKGLFKAGGTNISFRKVLVTVQFTVSVILIVSTVVVMRQMKFMQQAKLGFDRDHIITLPYNGAISDRFEAFRTELMSDPGVRNATRSSRIPTGRLLDALGSRIRKTDTLAPMNAEIKFVSTDHEFVPTYGIKVVAGRGFSRDYGTDTAAFLLNEAAVSALGFTSNEDVIGRDFGYGSRNGKIIGVIGDFHFESMHQKIVPLVLLVPRNTNSYGRISIKVSGNRMPETLAHIEKSWQKFLPEVPYEYTFLDENFARLYDAEQKQRSVFSTFSVLAIIIACLGLFGLSAFTISQRIREIGVRKVLGASLPSILLLLSKDFVKLVLIASIVAFPIAWWAMKNWLQEFSYRTTISWWIFVIAGAAALLVALLTIGYQAFRAAMANPVKSLRTE